MLPELSDGAVEVADVAVAPREHYAALKRHNAQQANQLAMSASTVASE